jgi:hypothetical protein
VIALIVSIREKVRLKYLSLRTLRNEPTHRKNITMATLKILEVECVKVQDSTGKDEISVEVDGAHLSGPHEMGRKDVITLNATHTFTGSVAITLMEEDPGTDDNLGTVWARESQIGQGTLTGTLHRLSGADYHIKYYVVA